MHESETESEVAQWCPTLSDPMDYSLPGSSVHGIFQARVLEWGAIAFSLISYRHLKLCSKLSSQLFSHPNSVHNLSHLQDAKSTMLAVPQAKTLGFYLIPPCSWHSRSITKPGQLPFQNLSRVDHFSLPPPWAKLPSYLTWIILFFHFLLGYMACRTLVLWPGISPLQWKLGVLTTEPLGNSLLLEGGGLF